MKSFLKLAALFNLAFYLGTMAQAQSVWTNVSASTTWLGPLNWNPNGSPTNGTEVAQFNGTAPTSGTVGIGINMNTLGGLCRGGAIEVTSARSSLNLMIGNSSTTVAGVLALNGAMVNGVANTILRNAGAGTTTLIITNGQTGTGFFMGLSNNLAGAVIDASSAINIYSIFSGNGFTKTGAGTLTLFAANLYSGSTTISNGTVSIGNDTATLGNGAGTLVLAGGTLFRASQTTAQTFTNAVSLTADSTISGNPTSGSRTVIFSSSSVSGTAGTLTISNTAASGSGVFQARFSGSFTFARPVAIGKAFSGSGTLLQLYNSAATGDQTWSGLISGSGTVYKNVSSGAGGNVIFSSGNTYTGNTEIRGGFFGLGTDNALGFGNVIIGFDPNPIGLFASGAARQLTNDLTVDTAIVTSTNLQIKGSQNLTLSGRILIHTNTMFFTISNTALTTFSGTVTNAAATSLGICKLGSGKLVLSGSNTFSGTTTAGAGTLALTGTGSINTSTNLTVIGGATLDISGLSSALTLSSAQTLRGVSTNSATGTIILSGTASLTLGATSPLALVYTNGTPVLTVTGGVLTVASGNVATVTVANGGAGLPPADYKLIAAGTGGSVAGTEPTALTVNGDGISGGSSLLVISNAELYLRVLPAATPPATPVANAASSTNVTAFTASWNSASGAGGYRLDVSTLSDFSSFVSGYNNLDVGAVTSFAVTGLSPSTTYFYQVRATNAFGTSASSSPAISVTTLVAPYVWNTGDGFWSVAGSWQYANVPGNGAAPGFTGAGGNSTNDLTGLLLSSLTFSNGAGAYVVSGNALVVSNGIVNSSTASETITAPLTLGAAQTFSAAAGALTFTNTLANAGSLLTVSATANTTNSGAISGGGGLTKTGAGTLALSGANTFTGPTLISAGTLKVSGGAAIDDTASVALANVASATLALDNSETVGLLSGGGATGGTLALGANNLTVGGTTNFSGPITGTGKLIKTGAGTLTLDRTTACGPDFTLRVEAGTNDLNRGGSALSGILGTGNRIELAGGTLQLSASLQASFVMSVAGLDIYSDSTLRYNRTGASSSQTPTNTFPLNFKAAAKLSLTYNAAITANTAVFDGAVNTLQGNATFDPGAYTMTIQNPIGEFGGSYGLTKTGAGQLNLNAINTYSGPTTNLQGTIAVNATSTIGDGTGTFALAGGNLLDRNTRASAPIANPLLMTADTMVSGDSTTTGGSTRIFPLSGPITTVGGTLTLRNAGPTAGMTGNIFRVRFVAGGFDFTQPLIVGTNELSGYSTELEFYNDNSMADQIVSGQISGTGVLRRAVASGIGGRTILRGANTFTGGVNVFDGFFGAGHDQAFGTGDIEIDNSSNTNLVGLFADGGARVLANKIFLNGMTNLVIAGTNNLTFAGNWNLGGITKTLTISNTALTTVAGALTNSASVIKAGDGTLALTGTNTGTGSLAISAGTLALSGSGSIANSPLISVAAGATFDVSGLSSTFNLGASQTLSNNASATGTLNGNLNTSSGTVSVSYTPGTPAFNETNGTLTLAAGTLLKINNTGAALTAGSYKIISKATTGSVAGVLPSSVVVSGAGTTAPASLQIVAGELYLNVGVTTLSLTSSSPTSGYLDNVTFTAAVQTNGVTAGNATGTVQFQTNGFNFGSAATVSGGSASSASLNNLPRGTNLITAIYSGDGNYLGSSNTLNQIVTNHAPVVNGNSYTRNGLNTWRISVSNLLSNATDADNDTLTLDNVATSTNGITLVIGGGYVQYSNTNLVDDQFTYTVVDGFGGTNSAAITLTLGSSSGVGGQINNFTANGGTASMTFAGIPGYLYNVQVATNLLGSWNTIWTTNAPAGGVFLFSDSAAPQPDAYYRLMWNGN